MIYALEMQPYQQLWQSITPLYEAGEAPAIVRTVLDVKYGMTLTDIILSLIHILKVDRKGLSIGTVEKAQFNDYVSVDGQVVPISVVQISSEEGGIVLEKVVDEGEMCIRDRM